MDIFSITAILSLLLSLAAFVAFVFLTYWVYILFQNSQLAKKELQKQTRLLSEIAEKHGVPENIISDINK
jgi:ABC-type Na+ efflux pump permease subunit